MKFCTFVVVVHFFFGARVILSIVEEYWGISHICNDRIDHIHLLTVDVELYPFYYTQTLAYLLYACVRVLSEYDFLSQNLIWYKYNTKKKLVSEVDQFHDRRKKSPSSE